MKCPYNKIIHKEEANGYQSRTVNITMKFDDCIGCDCPFYGSQRKTINGNYETIEYCRKADAECRT